MILISYAQQQKAKDALEEKLCAVEFENSNVEVQWNNIKKYVWDTVEYFNCLGRMINDARCTHEIKSRIAMAKAAFKKKKTFRQQIALKFKKGTSKVLHLEYSFVWCWNLDNSERA